MPPKRKAPAAAAAGKGKSKKTYGKAPDLPEGELLTDFGKKQWQLGNSIGSGGFGQIYAAKKSGEKHAQYVMKVEPAENGPLFQETHFYQRVGKVDVLNQWKKQKGLKFLGIPPFIAAGVYEKNGFNFRFLVMPRLGADLEKHRESCTGERLASSFVFRLAVCCLDSLEYLHYSAQYVHADLKAENLLAASDNALLDGDEFFLVDYGLARKIGDNPTFKEVPKNAHDGTLIFTSLDAHRGCVPSYRGDVEILGYNILYWLSGTLPWIKDQNAPQKVFEGKLEFSTTFREMLARDKILSPFAKELTEYFSYVYALEYAERPDFDHLRDLLKKATATKRRTAAATATSSSTSSSSSSSTATQSKKPTQQRTPRNAVVTNGASTSKKPAALFKNFLDTSETSNGSTDGDVEKRGASSILAKRLVRPSLKTKVVLAEETPSPLPVRAVSPRRIIPGTANLRRYNPSSAAKRRSSILVKNKYLAPKKSSTAVKASITVNTDRRRLRKASNRITSDDEDD